MTLTPLTEWLDLDALADQRLLLEQEDGVLSAWSDRRLDPALLHLLMVVGEGAPNINYVDDTTYAEVAERTREEELPEETGANRHIVHLVRDMITEATKMGASDIHIEPGAESLRIRYRLDGRLRIMQHHGIEMRDEIISRVKVLADLDIAEKRKPQDGKIHMKLTGRGVDFRVSCIPTSRGEKVVIRILDKTRVKLDLADLGMPPNLLHPFREVIQRPHGLVLVTGPTGSGKTTTLYAALNEIKNDSLNIMTVEDPIEYQLDGLTQTQVRPRIGYGFGEALRGFLRQDPNVIMVGETRDLETAELSVRASLTGHLVLSTLHTNTAPGVIPRLIDMGIEPYLLGSALSMALAQRLLRELCPDCRQIDQSARAAAERHGFQLNTPIYRAVGCPACDGDGYLGRIPVFEGFFINDQVRAGIHQGLDEAQLIKLTSDYQPLVQHGLDLVANKRTSLEELLREAVPT